MYRRMNPPNSGDQVFNPAGVPPGVGGSPGQLVGGSSGWGGPQTDLNTFSSDFMSNIMNAVEDFAETADLFGTEPDGGINFERDYAQWFNPDDVVPSSWR